MHVSWVDRIGLEHAAWAMLVVFATALWAYHLGRCALTPTARRTYVAIGFLVCAIGFEALLVGTLNALNLPVAPP